MLSATKWTHTVDTGPDPESSLLNPTQPCRREVWWLCVAIQAAHPGAPTTGQKRNPCSSEVSEVHPPPVTLGTPENSACDCYPGGRAEVSWR